MSPSDHYIEDTNKFHSDIKLGLNDSKNGNFVIFGVTAEGVVNPVPTAKGMMYPHEVQANVLHHL